MRQENYERNVMQMNKNKEMKGNMENKTNNNNNNDLVKKMEIIRAENGGDEPEDWVGAYTISLDKDKMKWRNLYFTKSYLWNMWSKCKNKINRL